MELHIVIQGSKDLSGQLYRQLREAIESGRLKAGTRLPPSRLLAEQLGISRKTVSDTYALLTYDNLLTGKVGSGTFVNAQSAGQGRKQGHESLASAAIISRWRNISTSLRHPSPDAMLRYDFIGGATTRNQFPQDDWRRCTQHALRQTAKSRGLYSETAGLPALRDAIARHVAFSRGVRCNAEDVVVCNGAQQALDLLARVLIEPGCSVAVEDPGYPPARQLFAAQGAEVIGIPVDAEGICVDAIPEHVRLIYVTPSHQFPLGMPMSQARREALLEKALRIGAVIIEDDYDCEFRYEGRPTETLQSLDSQGVVAYVGTFSKSLQPELRLGYCILPPALIAAVTAAKQLADCHCSTLTQWTLAKFIDEGCLLKHIRRSHILYTSRRERIHERFKGDLARWFELVPSVAGFHLAVLAKVPVDMPLLVELARKVDVGLYQLAAFSYQLPPRSGLMLGYGGIETLDIDPALDRVRDILEQIA
ncbi:PLP-dependent aminotransferase family protein [Pseudomonas sp. JS3066]|uniref:MocR-like pyridoxine biosynthesis transcription factor PdxR n=1 Tax=unclassified Pseudomonas TaxID=196821 RepID=UPI000EA85E50|nr:MULTISPECIES: PLP-dependent aminotransferase family protein [unclassified Pseudomonas]AYF86643.1 PLP-dependent aminotransferase family protein [Pseudomonas sp. DY-1]MDH4653538.1 PLP-dependent aminotransferase family protein [Pseudomonas sp. BN606]MRK22114.1 PLP-dependent aminotransferase family protein [Pseudomonas sp. JG-B]WVK95885.1 PLP-dependent aminotransferase family protein [Pseudomonas sp. JS3066]